MIEKLIKRIAGALDKKEIPYMIIGGQAVLLYGTPRLTRDIDITLGVDADKFDVIASLCRKLKLDMLPANPREFARDTKVLPAQDKKLKIRLDFIFSFTPYERQALNRVKKVMLDGYAVKFASCEDVIIHKMFAGRAIDEEDVKNILVKNKNGVDFGYIKKWLLQFSQVPGQEKILQKFDGIKSHVKGINKNVD